jgi:hypothetical protein
MHCILLSANAVIVTRVVILEKVVETAALQQTV